MTFQQAFDSNRSAVASNAEIFEWWERRRGVYNNTVGLTGVLTTALLIICGLLGQATIGVPIGIPDPPVVMVLGAIVYGIAANICYTGGYIVDTLRRPYDPAFGPRAFRTGVIFSVVLTLVPPALCWTLLCYELLSR